MVSQCVNPKCGKSLHYLRDGKIFLLNVRSDEGSNVTRMEHFWLCGECSVTYIVKQVGTRVEVSLKNRSRRPAELDHDPDSMPIAV